MTVAIVQRTHPILRDKAREVPLSAIGSEKIETILRDMKAALEKEVDGVAIAAPQIDVSLRIFVVSKKALRHIAKKKAEEGTYEDLVFINPVIIKISKDNKLMEEGCLSIRYAYGKVRRASRATVEAYNEKGERFVRGASGLLAQIFQHEIDHLEGVLFTDKAKSLKELTPEEWEGMVN